MGLTSGQSLTPKDIARDIIMSGTAAQLPAAASVIAGVIFFETDTTLLKRNSGSAWVTIGDATGGGGPTGPASGDLAGSYPGPTIATDAVTYAKMQNVVADDVLLGRISGAGGNVEEITQAQATALINAFTPSGTGHLKGLVPDPGASAGTTRFLREDATFAVPPGSSAAAPMTDYAALIYFTGSEYVGKSRDGAELSRSATFATVFNATTASVATTGGGTVKLSSQDFNVTAQLNLPQRVNLLGESFIGRKDDTAAMFIYGTRLLGNFTGTIIDIAAETTPAWGYGSVIENIGLQRQTGTKASTTGIRIGTGETKIIRCGISDFGIGIRITGHGFAASSAVRNQILFTLCIDNGRSVVIDSSGGSEAPTDGQMIGCHFLSPTDGSGADVEVGAGGWHLLGCHLTEASGGIALLAATSNRFYCANNYFDGGGNNPAVQLSSATESSFVNNLILNKESGGIQMNAGSNTGAIVGTFFQATAGTPAANGLQYTGAASALRGSCYANVFANHTGHLIMDSANEPIANGYTNGTGIWPSYKADGNVKSA